MKILIEGMNLADYYAKIHESNRNGLKSLFDVKSFGKGYPSYDENIHSFLDMKDLLFGDSKIDLVLLTDCWDRKNLSRGLDYTDLDKLDCKKAILLADFWSEADNQLDEYIRFVESNGIDFIFTYFRAPFHLWKNTKIHKKLIWFPPSFEPHIFNDWGMEKIWDVGNLNAGIMDKMYFYPERYEIHQRLLKMDGIRYFYASHPGTGLLPEDTPLIGKNFSKAINQCRIFISSGNLRYKNFPPKYVEVMASKSCLLATECMDEDIIGLVDGYNYVRITEDNIEDKITYYLKHDDEMRRIAENGYRLAMERYTCYATAARLYGGLADKLYI